MTTLVRKHGLHRFASFLFRLLTLPFSAFLITLLARFPEAKYLAFV